MSAKPSTVPTWATDANYPAGAEPEAGTPTKVPLSAGQATIGWRPDKKPPAQEFNTQMNSIGDWCQYLNDGDLEGSITITGGDFEVDGALTAGGDAWLQSELQVDGVSTFNDLVNLDGGAQVPTGERITLVGAAKINHGDKYLGLVPNGFFSGSGSGSPAESGGALTYTLDTSGGKLTIPTGLKPGDRIKSVRVAYTSPGGAPTVTQKWNTYASAYDVAMTIGSTEVEFAVSVTTYTVDTPEAVALHENPSTNTLFAYAASLRLEATSNNTVIHGVSVVYDSTEVPTY